MQESTTVAQASGEANVADTPVARTMRPWLVVVACTLITAASLIRPPLHQLLPPFPTTAFGASWARFWTISAASSVALVSFVLAGGVLGDLFGRRRILLLGAAGFLIMIVLAAMARNPAWYLLATAGAGSFAALAIPMSVASIRLSFDRDQLLWPFAAYTVFTALASLSANVLSGFINGWFGWRAMLAPALLLGAVGLALAWRHVPESSARSSYRRLDAVGLAAWSAAIMALVFGLVQLRVSDLTSPTLLATFAVAAVACVLLTLWELRSPGPVLRNPPFPRRALTIIIIAGLILNFATIGYSLHLFNYLRNAQQYGPVLASFALAPLGVGLIGGGIQAGRQRHDRSHQEVVARGLLIMLVAITITAVSVLIWRDRVNYGLLAIYMALFGSGFALASTAWQTLYMGSMPPTLSGLSAAVSGAAGQLGGVIASTVLATFIVRFGTRDFIARLTAMGVPPERIEEATAALDRALQPEAAADPNFVQEPIITALLTVYRESYATAFGGVLLLSAALMVICVGLVWYGLRPGLRRSVQSHPSVE